MRSPTELVGAVRSKYADHELLGPLVDRYVEALPAKIEALEAAVQQADEATIFKLSHRLTGDAATYGFTALADLARRLELAGAHERRETLRQLKDLGRTICATKQAQEALQPREHSGPQHDAEE